MILKHDFFYILATSLIKKKNFQQTIKFNNSLTTLQSNNSNIYLKMSLLYLFYKFKDLKCFDTILKSIDKSINSDPFFHVEGCFIHAIIFYLQSQQ